MDHIDNLGEATEAFQNVSIVFIRLFHMALPPKPTISAVLNLNEASTQLLL